ncbi:succinate-semialdehyde dehydrogenase [Spirochaetia bacterium]|nr:succinate-semialdehyde dehydrogenase [Spirochaetia bacterium]
MEAAEYVSGLIERARTAQREFETYSQEKVDACVRAVGKVIYDHAEELAQKAVDETGMGVYEHKVVKNKGKPKATWYKLKGVKSRGIIRRIEEEGIIEVAKPIGVVGAITPVTNPIMTLPHNAMIALKGGNAILFSPHPKGKNCGKDTVNYMRGALKELGAPVDLVQIVEDPTVEISGLVMKLADACISTGGPGMVKAAYSSGKPAFGVGAGNVQCLIDRDANLADAVPKIFAGRCYDNGTLCTCEQSVICPEELVDTVAKEFTKLGAYYISDEKDVAKVRQAVFPDGGPISREAAGASPGKIAKLAGLSIPEGTKMLLVKLDKCGKNESLAREKLCPVLAFFSYKTWEDAVAIASANLDCEGKGHSVVIHSFTDKNIEYAGVKLPVSRFAVNQQGSASLGGTLLNGLNPTATLGCGSWGNNSISENLWYHHLINISRISYEIKGRKVPTDEEIWGD